MSIPASGSGRCHRSLAVLVATKREGVVAVRESQIIAQEQPPEPTEGQYL